MANAAPSTPRKPVAYPQTGGPVGGWSSKAEIVYTVRGQAAWRVDQRLGEKARLHPAAERSIATEEQEAASRRAPIDPVDRRQGTQP